MADGGSYWECTTCTYHNNVNFLACEMCGTSKPQIEQSGPPTHAHNHDAQLKDDMRYAHMSAHTVSNASNTEAQYTDEISRQQQLVAQFERAQHQQLRERQQREEEEHNAIIQARMQEIIQMQQELWAEQEAERREAERQKQSQRLALDRQRDELQRQEEELRRQQERLQAERRRLEQEEREAAIRQQQQDAMLTRGAPSGRATLPGAVSAGPTLRASSASMRKMDLLQQEREALERRQREIEAQNLRRPGALSAGMRQLSDELSELEERQRELMINQRQERQFRSSIPHEISTDAQSVEQSTSSMSSLGSRRIIQNQNIQNAEELRRDSQQSAVGQNQSVTQPGTIVSVHDEQARELEKLRAEHRASDQRERDRQEQTKNRPGVTAVHSEQAREYEKIRQAQTNNRPVVSVEQTNSRPGVTAVHSEQAREYEKIRQEQTNNRPGTSVEHTNNRPGVTAVHSEQAREYEKIRQEQTKSRTGVSVEQTNNRPVVSVEQTVEQTNSRPGVTAVHSEQAREYEKIRQEQTNHRPGVSAVHSEQAREYEKIRREQTNSRPGVSVEQTNNRPGVSAVHSEQARELQKLRQERLASQRAAPGSKPSGPGPDVVSTAYAEQAIDKLGRERTETERRQLEFARQTRGSAIETTPPPPTPTLPGAYSSLSIPQRRQTDKLDAGQRAQDRTLHMESTTARPGTVEAVSTQQAKELQKIRNENVPRPNEDAAGPGAVSAVGTQRQVQQLQKVRTERVPVQRQTQKHGSDDRSESSRSSLSLTKKLQLERDAIKQVQNLNLSSNFNYDSDELAEFQEAALAMNKIRHKNEKSPKRSKNPEQRTVRESEIFASAHSIDSFGDVAQFEEAANAMHTITERAMLQNQMSPRPPTQSRSPEPANRPGVQSVLPGSQASLRELRERQKHASASLNSSRGLRSSDQSDTLSHASESFSPSELLIPQSDHSEVPLSRVKSNRSSLAVEPSMAVSPQSFRKYNLRQEQPRSLPLTMSQEPEVRTTGQRNGQTSRDERFSRTPADPGPRNAAPPTRRPSTDGDSYN